MRRQQGPSPGSGRSSPRLAVTTDAPVQLGQAVFSTPFRLCASKRAILPVLCRNPEMVVFLAGERPVFGTQILYFIDPVFSKRATIDPPATGATVRAAKPFQAVS